MHACLELGEFDAGRFLRDWAQVLSDSASATGGGPELGDPPLRHWHVLARSAQPPRLSELQSDAWLNLPSDTDGPRAIPIEPLRQALVSRCWGLLPGVHRLRLALPEVLQSPEAWQLPEVLKSHAHLQTHLTLCIGDAAAYQQLATSFSATPTAPQVPDRQASVAVIGAGIAGAACARALADRGYRVTVFDQASAPASGASGLPVGLVAPHASPDDSVISRLSRAGLRAMRDAMTRHIREGVDWGDTGVQERRLPGKTRKGGAPAHWAVEYPIEGQAWTCAMTNVTTNAAPPHSLWHARGAWVRPASLVRALLDHPRIAWQGQAQVTHLAAADSASDDAPRWHVMHGEQPLAEADQVVLAMGPATPTLLQASGLPVESIDALPIRSLRGQLSWGRMADLPQTDTPWPETPVNGHGCFIHGIDSDDGPAWFAGSTYDRTRDTAEVLQADHVDNLARVQALLPEHAAALQVPFAQGQVRAWAGVRGSVPDRLPMVGAVPHAPGLWVCSAMGSRGLTLAVLCGELLAAQWTGEPAPLEPALARALSSHRFVKSHRVKP
jgi:tRNA 5-methylaminomethyl-2-thiouridine biosynthesis bifunctional protein